VAVGDALAVVADERDDGVVGAASTSASISRSSAENARPYGVSPYSGLSNSAGTRTSSWISQRWTNAANGSGSEATRSRPSSRHSENMSASSGRWS